MRMHGEGWILVPVHRNKYETRYLHSLTPAFVFTCASLYHIIDFVFPWAYLTPLVAYKPGSLTNIVVVKINDVDRHQILGTKGVGE